MLKWLPGPIIGVITLSFFLIETIVISSCLFLTALLVFITPKFMPGYKKLLFLMNEHPRYWGSLGAWFLVKVAGMKVTIRGRGNLSRQSWYLLLPNHQSWGDIVFMHYALDAVMPPLRFFMKQQLLWVPFIGLVCKTLGYPFMKRYTKDQIAKNPSLKGKDLEETKNACRRFKNMPISVISFVEGTRYTEAKAKRQRSPYQHLLKPKAGGIAFTLSAMSEELKEIAHVNIVYSDLRSPTFWQLYCGKVKNVIIEVETQAIPKDIIGDYVNDRDFRIHFQGWLNEVWQKKDQRLTELLREVNE